MLWGSGGQICIKMLLVLKLEDADKALAERSKTYGEMGVTFTAMIWEIENQSSCDDLGLEY